ncbi:hypothetical protein [Mesorhizobium humile]|uniref:hypothetical protein n=1 Tax=Mesorhizobium humile TaxID=3072313 RepID=UPI003D31D9EE
MPWQGEGWDVGEAAAFLASDEARFITGQVRHLSAQFRSAARGCAVFPDRRFPDCRRASADHKTGSPSEFVRASESLHGTRRKVRTA